MSPPCPLGLKHWKRLGTQAYLLSLCINPFLDFRGKVFVIQYDKTVIFGAPVVTRFLR